MNKQTRQKIILTPSDSSLVGKITDDSEHVHILLDTRSGGFTVTLPTATGSMQRELIFKNIGTNNATIVPITGEYIDYSQSHVVGPLDLVSVWSDLVRTWWLLDSNALGSPVYVKDSATPAHYWKILVSASGILSTMDMGTSI